MPAAPLSPELLDLQEAVAGRYSVDREIGRGGMGIVFLARDVALDRPVAIKLFPLALARRPELRERFLNEARTAARLSHPNIVPIYGVEEHGDLVFFVMAYVEGQTLTERIAARGPLPVREGVRMLRQLAWALVHAHAQGVVHRDIKSDNIMLEDGTGRVVVTDFGIAVVGREREPGDGDPVIGTPEFMSPEQVRGEAVDARSDLYSLGVVAFLALAGRYPHPSGAPSEIMAHHLNTPPLRLTTAAPGVPAKLGDVLDRCLVKNREERVESAADLTDRLGAALEERSEVPVPVRHFVEELKRRGRGPVLIYALFGLWLGPTLAVGLFYAAPTGLLGGAALILLAAGFSAIPLANVLPRIRRVLRAGYARDDIVRALRQDLEARHEELVFLYGERYREDARRLRRLAFGALGTAVALAIGTASMVLPPGIPILGVVGTGIVGAVAGLRADKRSDRVARRRWRFWKGRVGDWLFRLAGIRLKRVALPSTALTARPTELAVGAAVLSLYESLPPESQRALPDLHRTVQGLEDDAQRMRRLIDDCDAVLRGLEAEAGAGPSPAAPSRRSKVGALREQAAQRMQQAVAALETLRVDLLRLSAGTVEIGSVTTRLGSAREVAADIQRLLEAQEEVTQLLER
jgi:serine/threonine-protein kinase